MEMQLWLHKGSLDTKEQEKKKGKRPLQTQLVHITAALSDFLPTKVTTTEQQHSYNNCAVKRICINWLLPHYLW